jgi:hypothetical protein
LGRRQRCRRHLGCCCRRRYAGFRIVPVAAKSQATEIHGRRPREGAAHTVLEFAHLGADSTVRSVTLHPSVGSTPSHGGLAPLEPPWPPSGCRPNAPTARSRESRRSHAWRRAYRYKVWRRRRRRRRWLTGAQSGSATSIRSKLARSREGPTPTLDGPCPSARAVPSARGSHPTVEPARLGWAGRASPSRRAGGDSHLAVHLLACVRVLRHTRGATPRCKRAARCCSESTLCLGSR